MKKRHNSTDRSNKGMRPRSSKGHRGYQTSSSSTSHIPKIKQNKSEDRILKSQGNQRAILQAQAMQKYSKGAEQLGQKPFQL